MNRIQSEKSRSAHWMRQLAFQYQYIRKTHPHDRLMIVFDIDGTILDTRHTILAVIKAYDSEHGTSYFTRAGVEDINCPETELPLMLRDHGIPEGEQKKIFSWCIRNYWHVQKSASSCQPYPGVLDVIRWFQLQPNTCVGLNTGRDESLRALTLESLNRAGSEYRVEFSHEQLYMNRGEDLAQSKAEGIRHFEGLGCRVFAMVDNEPANLRAIAQHHREKDILLLHASTIFQSSPAHSPEGTASGSAYDLSELISEKVLPPHVQFVWHGVDDTSILRQFLASNVHWAELHVRSHRPSDRIILRRRGFEALPLERGEVLHPIEEFLSILMDSGRGVKLDIKEPGLAQRIIPLLKGLGFEDERVWIGSSLYKIQKAGVRAFKNQFPGSIRQTPVDFLAPLVSTSPIEVHGFIEMLRRTGFNRFSLNWKTPGCRRMVTEIQSRGLDVNIYNVPDLNAFLQAMLLMPRSITSYFNFPKWFYFGGNEHAMHEAADQKRIA